MYIYGMEQFKQCLFSDSHLIGNNGTVKRLDKHKIRRYGTDILVGLVKSDGYKMYYLKNKWHYAHRLVASHYLPNDNNLSDVNHKDGVKSNNNVNNLEWMSHSDNLKHSFDVLGRVVPKGDKHWLYGKEASKETKDKMSEAKKGRKRLFRGKWL